MAKGMAYPSYIGTVDVSPSPESSTRPVVLPVEYNPKTDWMAKYNEGTLKVSNIIYAVFYLFFKGLLGAKYDEESTFS